MSVEFEQEEQFNNVYDQSLSNTPKGITAWLIESKIAKDEKSAKNIMILISIICFALAIYFLIK
jgi:hypothetical protein